MSVSTKPVLAAEPDIRVPMPAIIKFLRQLGHDLRNHLNAAELQAAFIAELTEDPEITSEIKRLRSIVSEVGVSLGRLTSSLGAIKLSLMDYSAADFMEDLRKKLHDNFPNEYAKVEWNLQLNGASLQIDPQILQLALTELFANAFQFDRSDAAISVQARVENGDFVFLIREPKEKFEHSTEGWGLEPLQSLRHGHYGLGLYKSRIIIEAHGGQLGARFDKAQAALVTTVTLPLAKTTDK